MSIKKIQKFLKKQKIHKFINKQKVQKFINKHLYKIILVVFIAFMITNPRNKLFKHLITYKNTLLGKMISVIVILYVSSKNITHGILLGVIFMITLFIYNKKKFEHIEEGDRDRGDRDIEEGEDDGDGDEGDEDDGDYKTVREVADAAFQEFDTEKERQLAYDIVDKATDVTDAKKILERLHDSDEWRDGGDEEEGRDEEEGGDEEDALVANQQSVSWR